MKTMKATENKFSNFLSKGKYYLGLIFIIVIILIWHFGKIYFLEKSTEKERIGMINKYEMRLDSLNAVNMQLTSKVFSWAIRGELIRGNKDQINQYFNEFIKTPGILKLQFINSANSKIEISTDKKDEGLRNVDYINLMDQEILTSVSDIKIITPIAGMNKQIGVFILEANKLGNNLKED
ncbi:MAG: hypothetical protein PHV20_12060 [Bacteroidales bacterium]|nr:hypothetical protein [Bacteroidales bacterium]